MNFDDYFGVIVKSVSQTGYNAFLPSACVVEDGKVVMKVLEGDLSEDGEEELAWEWGSTFFKEALTVFLAYRRGQRTVTVLEFLGSEPIRKREIKVDPYGP